MTRWYSLYSSANCWYIDTLFYSTAARTSKCYHGKKSYWYLLLAQTSQFPIVIIESPFKRPFILFPWSCNLWIVEKIEVNMASLYFALLVFLTFCYCVLVFCALFIAKRTSVEFVVIFFFFSYCCIASSLFKLIVIMPLLLGPKNWPAVWLNNIKIKQLLVISTVLTTSAISNRGT